MCSVVWIVVNLVFIKESNLNYENGMYEKII